MGWLKRVLGFESKGNGFSVEVSGHPDDVRRTLAAMGLAKPDRRPPRKGKKPRKKG